ncbi:MAG: DUF2884 family protein, partial [Stenotrophomonas maltophilia]
PIAACNAPDSGKGKAPADQSASAPATSALDTDGIGKTVQEATDKARKEITQANISISNGTSPKAELSPQGDLLIDGKAVTVDAHQRALLLDYRKQVESLASAGMEIGVAGANLGVKAAGEAIKGMFSGDTQGIEARVNEEARKIEDQAQKLCGLLPGMMARQQALAAALPAFQPYATMDQSDIDDCGK